MPPSNLARVRKICLGFTQATEVEAWGASTFRIGKIFAMHAASNDHHGAGREGIWVKTDSFTQDLLVHGQPTRYFKPPYVGPFGWTGVYLDANTDWIALVDLLHDAYLAAAPKKLKKQMDSAEAMPATKKSVSKKPAKKKAPAQRKSAKKRARSLKVAR